MVVWIENQRFEIHEKWLDQMACWWSERHSVVILPELHFTQLRFRKHVKISPRKSMPFQRWLCITSKSLFVFHSKNVLRSCCTKIKLAYLKWICRRENGKDFTVSAIMRLRVLWCKSGKSSFNIKFNKQNTNEDVKFSHRNLPERNRVEKQVLAGPKQSKTFFTNVFHLYLD